MRFTKLATWLKSLFKRSKNEPLIKKDAKLPDSVVWQTSVLEKDEVIIYTDEHGEKHVISREPISRNKEYKVLIIDYHDIHY